MFRYSVEKLMTFGVFHCLNEQRQIFVIRKLGTKNYRTRKISTGNTMIKVMDRTLFIVLSYYTPALYMSSTFICCQNNHHADIYFKSLKND